jgi:trk system potassium uptake protein TrkA
MKIVIVGFGRVGMRTARTLQNEGHEVIVVERENERVERARTEGFDAYEGDGGEESVLQQAGLDDTDAVGGLTGDLNTNFSACVIGDAHGCRTVLRVNEDFSEDLYDRYSDNVDEIIYPERLGAMGAKTALLGGDFNVVAEITERLTLTTITIPEDSPIIGDRVVEVDLPGEARIYAHGRADESMTIPLPQTAVNAGDTLAIMADPDDLGRIRTTLKGKDATV